MGLIFVSQKEAPLTCRSLHAVQKTLFEEVDRISDEKYWMGLPNKNQRNGFLPDNDSADACGSYSPRGLGTRLSPPILQRPVANRKIDRF